LYYQFICRVANSRCRSIIIIAGNHDSPSFLNAPKNLLRALNVHVIGAITEQPEDEVIILNNAAAKPQVIVCAVPYLRDKDIRTVEPGETIADKDNKLIAGVRKHYAEVCAIAEQRQREFADNGLNQNVPIIAMGHIFTAGGKTIADDGVRELYVGALAHVEKDVFPEVIDYLALGHLHVPQLVAGTEHIRYSGSPIAMGFGEARQEKKVIVIEFHGKKLTFRDISIPIFQPLERLTGSINEISARIEQLKLAGSRAWLEIDYNGSDLIVNLPQRLNEMLADSEMELLRVKNRRVFNPLLNRTHAEKTLDDLSVNDVFARCLDAFKVPEAERMAITRSYNEIINSLYEDDLNAQ
jgi:exonuclease SbcD